MTDPYEDIQHKVAVLECMIEDAGAWMMLSGQWPTSWLNDPERRRILWDLNCGPSEGQLRAREDMAGHWENDCE